MLFYDIVITFGQEVERIWMRKLSMVTILWFLVRFLFFPISRDNALKNFTQESVSFAVGLYCNHRL